MEPFSSENSPRITTEDSTYFSLKNTTYMYTAADWDEVNLKNNLNAVDGTGIQIKVNYCDQSSLPAGEKCAGLAELIEWLKYH
jgi:hypothetical protein